MSRHSFVLPLTLLLACDFPLFDFDSTGPGNESTDGQTTPGMHDSGGETDSGASTSAGSESGDDPSVGTTGEPPGPSTGETTVVPVPTDVGGIECDPYDDQCPTGEKCVAYGDPGGFEWSLFKCAPIDPAPGQAGDPCTVVGEVNSGIDSCDRGLMCFWIEADLTGSCVPWCDGSPQNPTCADPDSYCAVVNGGLSLCLPTCDPLGSDCAAGEVCVRSPTEDSFTCIPDDSGAEGQVFDPCEYINVCDPGLACVPSDAAVECDPLQIGCCSPLCDLTQANTCPGVGQECVPVFQDPAPKYADVGVCALPG